MGNVSVESNSCEVPFVLIGAGGHAKVLLDLIELIGGKVLFVTDRNSRWHGHQIGSTQIRGFDDLIYDLNPANVRLINAVGSIGPPVSRRAVYQRFSEQGYIFQTLIHPSAVVSSAAQIEAGAQIMAGAVVQTGSRVHANALVNTRASVDHDCVIGPHAHVGPGVTLSGDVHVGETAHVGTGATVIQGIRIGREAMIGAGAVVIRNVAENQCVVGVPAKQLRASAYVNDTQRGDGQDAETFTIMMSAAGRRVALLQLLRESIRQLGLKPRLVATDVTRNSAALHLSDVSRIVRRYSDPRCLDELLEICREYSVKLIVPTIDPELSFYAEHRQRFEAEGTRVMISSPQAVRMCNDKRSTHRWLIDQGFPTVRQIDAKDLLANSRDWIFPVFAKPVAGSSSIGARVVHGLEELRLVTGIDDYIVQEIAPGMEYTVDVFLDAEGHCHCAVPRLRIETRGGEVSKGMTFRSSAIESLASRVAEAMDGARGVVNIQIFYDASTGHLNVIEINPRFGGGYPLTHRAGAEMARWVVEEVLGRPSTAARDSWKDSLVMLRYDEAYFTDSKNTDLPVLAGKSTTR